VLENMELELPFLSGKEKNQSKGILDVPIDVK